jgi:hypothetical protein
MLVAGVAAAFAARLAAAADPAPTAETLTDEQVTAAITRGLDFLIKDMDTRLAPVRKAADVDRGKQEVVQWPGDHMLGAYALLHVGQETRDPRLSFREERVQLMKDVLTRWEPPRGFEQDTYATALQALALSQLPRLPEVEAALTRVAKRLVGGMAPRGGYGYHLANASGNPDQSNGQYALLGAWAAADYGAPVPTSYWKQTDEYWRRIQLSSGEWYYYGPYQDQTGSTTMTVAGLASLYVCDEFLNRTPRLDMQPDPALENGLAAVVSKVDPASTNLYYLYGLERVGLATGLKYIGKTNWYRAAAAHLVQAQVADGSFSGGFAGASAARNTAYALLFLVRGRAPIVMNKLQYDGTWNARPRDSANAHAYLTRVFERRLNSQIVPMDAPVSEWQDAPILYIAGSKDTRFTDDQVAKLRRFVEEGGLIFSSAEGGRKEFTDAMAAYAARVAPAGTEAAWRDIPAAHPLYSVIGRPDPLPKLLGLSNGVRELWVHSPVDYGAIWQSRDEKNKAAWEFPARLFMYVASKNGLRTKLQPAGVAGPATAPAASITMAQLEFAGNWNPEPGAWPRLGKILAAQTKTGLWVNDLKVEDLPRQAPLPPLAHLSGVGDLTLTPDQEKAVQAYVAGGGTLFVEAVGGDAAFAKSAQAALAKLFPEAKLRPVPADYLLYAGTFSPNAAKIGEVEYRRSWVLEHGQQSQPRLQYMTVGGRVGVVFSEEDLTHGLLGMNTAGVAGYMPDSALALARNLVFFAAINQKK